MSTPENLFEIIGRREPNETCSQFVFGGNLYYVDEAFRELVSKHDGYRLVRDPNSLVEGDLVFYGSALNIINHVAKVDRNGLLLSKFFGDPHVYCHELLGNPIPSNYTVLHIMRRVPANMSAASCL